MPDVLDDVLEQSLRVIFCGTAVGTASAVAGAYYAHPQNKFWKILHHTGLTPELLAPHQFRNLLQYRIGLTDLVKSHFGMDHQIPLPELRAEARVRLCATVESYRPQFLAFTSKKAGLEFLGHKRELGPQAETIAGTRIWILPSTSGAANGSWRPDIWRQFAKEVRANATSG